MVTDSSRALCKAAELYYYDFLCEQSWPQIPEHIIDHIEQCCFCLWEISRLKTSLSEAENGVEPYERQVRASVNKMLELHFAHITREIRCDTVKSFLPRLLDPASVVRIPTPVTVHIDNCQKCREDLEAIREFELKPKQLYQLSKFFENKPAEADFSSGFSAFTTSPVKMQELYETFCAISERPDSDVVTFYELAPSLAEREEFLALDEYSDWPIRVWVKSKVESEAAVKTISFAQKLKERLLSVRPKQIRLPATAAAIIVAVILLFTTLPKSYAVSYAQVCQAVTEIKNVCISLFSPEEAEPLQKEWVSRPLNIMIQKNQKQVVLFDLENNTRKIKDLTTNSVQTVSITGNLLNKAQNSIAGSFGLLPFDDITDLPEDSQWNHIDDKDVGPNTEVYELKWVQKDKEAIVFRKWRVFIDCSTHLPKRSEDFYKLAIGDKYTLKQIKTVTYPTEAEIEVIFKDVFDQP